MPTPRSKLICLETSQYYHCVSRCVRRTFLCGKDSTTNQCYDHRRDWIEERLLFLADVFCIDVCAYAVMSNHCHVVLRINEQKAKQINELNVAKRWVKLCKGTLLVQEYIKKENVGDYELATLQETLKIYRQRLSNISWFMRMLNEPIARRANQEDNCTGRFWEGRFHSQALVDEPALIACMTYVDLNPIRAGVDKTPETSNHTSIQRRINAAKNSNQPSCLLPFSEGVNQTNVDALPFKLDEYLRLLDTTGRCIRDGKSGRIDADLPEILNRLAIEPENWLILTTKFETSFPGVAGNSTSLEELIEKNQRKRRCNLSNSRKLFG